MMAEGCYLDSNGTKVCKCQLGYAERNGKCEVCGCGPETKSCRWDSNDRKRCTCSSEFQDRLGTCEMCSCGWKGKNCRWNEDGSKNCTCDKGYEFDGVDCNVCNCGWGEERCEFTSKRQKKCICKPNYAQKGSQCEACNCGQNATSCVFHADLVKECLCDVGYAGYDGKCRVANCFTDHECLNGGRCVNKGKRRGCSCLRGVSGVFCEVVNDCSRTGKYKDCRNGNGKCKYSTVKEEAICECGFHQILNSTTKKCVEDPCNNCMHGSCTFERNIYNCRCYEGYSGIYCDTKHQKYIFEMDNTTVNVIISCCCFIALLFCGSVYIWIKTKRLMEKSAPIPLHNIS